MPSIAFLLQFLALVACGVLLVAGFVAWRRTGRCPSGLFMLASLLGGCSAVIGASS